MSAKKERSDQENDEGVVERWFWRKVRVKRVNSDD
jgi:hypothetical protein